MTKQKVGAQNYLYPMPTTIVGANVNGMFQRDYYEVGARLDQAWHVGKELKPKRS